MSAEMQKYNMLIAIYLSYLSGTDGNNYILGCNSNQNNNHKLYVIPEVHLSNLLM